MMCLSKGYFSKTQVHTYSLIMDYNNVFTTDCCVNSAAVVSDEFISFNTPDTELISLKVEALFSIMHGMSVNFLFNAAAR
jgi:hypothetical protein